MRLLRRNVAAPGNLNTSIYFMCHNEFWQGAAHADYNIEDLYLRPYKTVIDIKSQETQESSKDEYCRSCCYINWLSPISGQDNGKLVAKPVKKEIINSMTKADAAMKMLSRLNIRGV